MRGHPLVEQAHATLCRLADAPPATTAARAAIGDIERTWERPFALGIGGPPHARTELWNLVCGARVFDPYGRPLGSAAIRVRRGLASSFRVLREDGWGEDQLIPPDQSTGLTAAQARVAVARVAAEGPPVVPPPPIWMFWRWILWWWQNRRRKQLVPPVETYDDSEVSALEAEASALEAGVRATRQRALNALREVASGGPGGRGVLEVEITLADSVLPENIELVELVGATRASAEVDAVLLAQDDKLLAPTRGGHPLALGDFATVIPSLTSILADARALRLARRIETKIKTVLGSLADAIERREENFKQRIAKLHALRIEDPVAFAAEQIARMRGEISASVTAVVEHATVHLGSELAQLQDEWIGLVGNASDGKALDAAIAKVEEEWDARPRRIAEEVRVLVVGGLGGSARDIYPKVVDSLAQFGLPDEHAKIREAPALPPLSLLPTLNRDANKLEKSGWFAGLFRGFDAKRTSVREKIHERVERMREVAASEMLDAEPGLNQAIGTALTELMLVALDHQKVWLDDALDAERAAIDGEREVVEPLRSVHDAVRTETYKLTELLAQLERSQPAISVAAAASETASLSR